MRATLLLAAALLAALPLARAAPDAATPTPSPSSSDGGPVAATAAELHAALAARDAAVVRVGGADGKVSVFACERENRRWEKSGGAACRRARLGGAENAW